jgi:solute carrier family 25 carnitine/acylcarnitine transporter 20/29
MLLDTLRHGGIFGSNGIFRGLLPPLLMVVPTTAVAFWGYDVGRRWVLHYDGVVAGEGSRTEGVATSTNVPSAAAAAVAVTTCNSSRSLTTAEVCVAGAISALPTSLIVGPTERIKCLLQAQQQQHPQRPHDIANGTSSSGGRRRGVEFQRHYYGGTYDCITKLYNEGGLRSLCRGTGMTFVRGVPGTMAYFAAYEYAKDGIMSFEECRRGYDIDNIATGDDAAAASSRSRSQPSALAILIAGGFAGMAYWAAIIPIIADVLKSRYQAAPLDKYPGGYAEVYRTLIREDGYAGLFRGYRPAMMRAIPASMARSVGMEVTRFFLE